jgi:DNA gyrase subunit B
VGISVVNALSSFVDVDVARDGKGHHMRFEGGIPIGQLAITDLAPPTADKDIDAEIERLQAQARRNVGDDAGEDAQVQIDKLEKLQVLQQERKTGTSVTFLPDVKVFKGEAGTPDITLDTARLRSRMDEIAYLNAGLLLSLQDKRDTSTKSKSPKKLEVFYHAGGLSEYVELLCRTKTPLFQKGTKAKSRRKGTESADPVSGYLSEDGHSILCSGESAAGKDGSPPISISVALRWSADMYTESILSFCNNIRTRDGGSHEDGLKTSLTRTVNQMAKRLGKVKEGSANIPGEFIREGLTAIISVAVPDPEFEGQTKGRLGKWCHSTARWSFSGYFSHF